MNSDITKEIIGDGAQTPKLGRLEDITDLRLRTSPRSNRGIKKLGEWHSTAICGNDIGSSCLYVSVLAIKAAGILAPLALLAIGGVLYLFRKVYGEVLSAMPLNGGAYNALLNTTTKLKASVAACLTILSYLATAVISGSEAVHYAATLFPNVPHGEWFLGLSIIKWCVLGVLTLFAILTVAGIGESAKVALVIFVIHIFSLILLCAFGLLTLIMQPEILISNFNAPLPQVWHMALFFGFAAAFLGVSGFESSANFVEEQEPGVFPKTLRNMWLIVIVFNPLIAFLALAVVPQSDIAAHTESFLAHMGVLSGGEWLGTWISINATLVLSGAVLTAFVGSNGLLRRMTLDGCLPQVMLRQTKWRTDWVAIGVFWALACSIFLATKGRLESLASVYALSFLSVMALFAIGNMLLKIRRRRLPRSIQASWYEVAIAFVAVSIGLVGNLMFAGKDFFIFLNYFGIGLAVVWIMLLRSQILFVLARIFHDLFTQITPERSRITNFFVRTIESFRSRPVVYFSRGR